MILIRESDNGTDIRRPRRHTDGKAVVVVDSYTNGVHTGVREYSYRDWTREATNLAAGGFIATDSGPDLRVDLNIVTMTVTVAGGRHHFDLAKPGSGDLDDPAESLVEQADTELFRAGYLRTTNWWATISGSSLTTVAVPTTPASVSPEHIRIARAVLEPAAAAVRAEIDASDERQVPDWLALCEDPISDGYDRTLLLVQQRRTDEYKFQTGFDYPGHLGADRVVNAIEHLFSAVVAAQAGNVDRMANAAARVQLTLAGVAART